MLVGSPYFISPELIKGNYSKKSDMWSLGVMLFLFLSGWYPFNGTTEEEVFRSIQSGKYSFMFWDHVSMEAKELISSLLVVEPEERLRCEQAL